MAHEWICVGYFSADRVKDQNAIMGGFEKPTIADFRLANGDSQSEVVGSVKYDRDIHLAQRFRNDKDTGTKSSSVPKMPEGLHVELSDWCAGCAGGNMRPYCNSAV